MTPEQIIKRPIVLTEKSTMLREGDNKVIFEVARTPTRSRSRTPSRAVQRRSVLDVNTLLMRGKDKRMGRGYAKLQNWKKAIVTLKEGDAIQFFDEEEKAE
jgi:large subunit ribosomal protein L23